MNEINKGEMIAIVYVCALRSSGVLVSFSLALSVVDVALFNEVLPTLFNVSLEGQPRAQRAAGKQCLEQCGQV